MWIFFINIAWTVLPFPVLNAIVGFGCNRKLEEEKIGRKEEEEEEEEGAKLASG